MGSFDIQKIKDKLNSIDWQAINQKLNNLAAQVQNFIASQKNQEQKPAGPQKNLAVYLGHSKIIVMECEHTPDGLSVLSFKAGDRVGTQAKDTEEIKKLIADGKFESKKVRISMKGQGVIARFIQFPKMKPEEVRSAIAFEAEKHIPFKADEVIVDYHIIDAGEAKAASGHMQLLLVAVKKEEIYPAIKLFQDADLQIEFIDIDALAAINALEVFHPDAFKGSAAILDMGTELSTLSVIREGKPRFIRDISYGTVDIVKRLKRKLGLTELQAREKMNIPDEEMTPDVKQVMQDILGNLVTDLKVSMDYYLDQVPNAETVQNLFIAGGESSREVVLSTLKKGLGIDVQPIEITGKIKLSPQVDEKTFKQYQGILPMVLGLCLRDK